MVSRHDVARGLRLTRVSSRAGGLEWSAPRALAPVLGEFSNGIRPGPGRGLQLDVGPRAGRILMSGSYDQIDPKPKGQRTVDLVWWSDEPEQAWHLSPSRHLLDVDESSLTQLANGSLLLSMRNAVRPQCKCRAVSRSDDNGCARHDQAPSRVCWPPAVPCEQGGV